MNPGNTFTPKEILLSSFHAFWEGQFRVEETAEGLVMCLPLMDSTGWQVELLLTRVSQTQWILHDNGHTLSLLMDAGRNPRKGKLEKILADEGKRYGFEAKGLRLERVIEFPFDPVEIQIFAEGLVSLSHLCPKGQTTAAKNTALKMDERIGHYFYEKSLQPQRNYKLSGTIETDIVVDYYVEGPRTLALETVGRRKNIHGYMEQWGWRWSDLKNAHPDLIRAMVFDPDNQVWDKTSLKIGESACDIFVPYYEAEQALDQAIVA